MIFYIAIHILPILLVFVGIVPAIYFFVKIKLKAYRILVILNLILNFFFVFLYVDDLDVIFMQNVLTSPALSFKIGAWELFNILNIIRLICFDLLIYYLYTHTKIIVKSSRGSFYTLVAFLAKDSKIYNSTLKFAIITLVMVVVLFEILFKGTSDILSLISNLIQDKF